MSGAGDPVEGRLQAGSRALLLLADPANVSILRQLAGGPLETMELLDRVGFVSRSTYFERMRGLEALSLVSRTRRGDVPPIAECKLETSGERLLSVARHLEAWLAKAPGGPLKLGEAYATATVNALAVAWGSTALRWLAERPHSLAELERLVHVFGYRKLERIVRDLVEANLVEPVATEGRPRPYAVTEWGRWAAGLLTAAMRWERHEIARQSASVSSIEAEGVMLLGIPLMELPAEASGTCALLVDADLPARESLGGAVVRLSGGRPVSWEPAGSLDLDALELEADCWVRGSALSWLGTPTSAPGAALSSGGDLCFAESVVAALQEIGSLRPSVPVAGDTASAGHY